jgi:hypothetical protein
MGAVKSPVRFDNVVDGLKFEQFCLISAELYAIGALNEES